MQRTVDESAYEIDPAVIDVNTEKGHFAHQYLSSLSKVKKPPYVFVAGKQLESFEDIQAASDDGRLNRLFTKAVN